MLGYAPAVRFCRFPWCAGTGPSLPAPALQAKGADLVIALTHMRLPNDLRLAESAPEIDLVLGG